MARILIIDDDVTLRQALTKHLELAGHDVRQAAHGVAGIRERERYDADLVIVDIFMPGQGGLQTIDQLRRQWPGVKIVAITGVSGSGTLDVEGHATALGANHFLQKPFEADSLLNVVARLTGESERPDGASP